MGKFIFVPAMIGQVKNMFTAGKLWKGVPVNSFSKGCVDYHPYLLASAWWEMKDDVDFRKKIDVPDDMIFYGDSGGYQSVKMGIELEVEKTLKWQEKSCHRAMAFDHPPSAIKVNGRSIPTTEEVFDLKMQQTYENNTKAILLRTNFDLEYYNVMQGETLPRRNKWYDKMKDLEFEHLAIATRPHGSGLAQALALCHLHSKGYTGKVHVLGVGGTNVIPIFPYIKHWFEEITIDSSSYGQGVRTREYYINMSKAVIFGEKDDDFSRAFKDRAKIDGLECQCKTCKMIDKGEVEVLWGPGSMGGGLITSHNLRVVLNYVNYLNDVKDVMSDRDYKDMFIDQVVNKQRRPELTLALNFIDNYKEHGIEKTYNKYGRALEIDSKRVVQQESLF